MTEISELLDGMKPIKASMRMEDDDLIYNFWDDEDVLTLIARAKNSSIERTIFKDGGNKILIYIFGPFEDEEFADILDGLTDIVEDLEVQNAD